MIIVNGKRAYRFSCDQLFIKFHKSGD